VASRIESLAEPGSIMISEKVFDEIKNQPPLTARSLGEVELKNVKRPMEVFALINEGLVIPTPKQIKSKTGMSYKSIAVLPFVNMSADPENEYFSDGISEEILNALTKIEGLNVTSRTSSFAFKGKREDIREIGTKLNVTILLEGSVRKAGNKVRITTQLINTTDGYHIWSEVYDRKLEDIFEVQDEISRNIANKLREKLTAADINSPFVKSHTNNIEAYNTYLKGNFYFNKWTPADARKAAGLYEEAIGKDPNFAQAHSGLANCYIFLGFLGQLTPKKAYPKAKESVLKALELDENLAESHLSLAMVKFFFDWDWEGAPASFKHALALKPSFADAHHYYGYYLCAIGKFDESITEIEKAHSLDPLSLPINNSVGYTHFAAKRYDEAIVQFEKTLELDPSFRSALENKGWAHVGKGEIDKAIEIFEEVQRQTGHPLKGVAPLGYSYAKVGQMENAKECLKKLKERDRTEKDVSLSIDFAMLYTGLKDFDSAFYHLEKAVDERLGAAVFLRHRPHWDELRSDPRFKELVRKVGLVD
ncbi:MAG: tetratricopeptide repeat protein, partial [Nitrososphaerales archaeon]